MIALRNTDNHGRNSAFLKYADGTVKLSPLYDFAPMFLDPEGIPRSSRWGKELEPIPGRPDWGKVAESFSPTHRRAGDKDISRQPFGNSGETP
jgi:serine/threonine-protein kinase HipA